MKQLEKNELSKYQYQHEVQILKSLSFPGIPELYDFGEDSTNYYIVEEYISGESLQSVLMQSISQEQLINYSRQIAKILCYLHTQEIGPILYLDMKVGHILIQNHQIYLIDFGLSDIAQEGAKTKISYGTRPYASPEQEEGRNVQIASDIFSLGILFGEMMKAVGASTNEEIMEQYAAMVSRMIRRDPMERPESMQEIISVLSQLEETLEGNIKPHPEVKIAVVGSQHRVGTTFVAAYCSSCMKQSGYMAAFYEEETNRFINQSIGTTAQWKNFYPRWRGSLRMIPNYGPFVENGRHMEGSRGWTPQVKIYDRGVLQEKQNFKEYDLILLVLGAKPWEYAESRKAAELLKDREGVIFFSTLCTPWEVSKLAKIIERGIVRIGIVENIYQPERKEHKTIAKIIIKELSDSKNCKISKGDTFKNCLKSCLAEIKKVPKSK